MNYISKLNIVAAEYLTKAGAARRACVTCAFQGLPSGAVSGTYNYRPVSVRTVSVSGSCNPGPNGQVHSQQNPYIGVSGTYVAFVDFGPSANCEYVTCTAKISPGNPQRTQSYAQGFTTNCQFTNPAWIKVPNLMGGPVGQPTGSGVPPSGV
jgi:hypothetical protein